MYGTLTEANTYFETYDLTGLWTSYTTAQRTIALNKATLQIDKLPFDGYRYSSEQTLEFPRVKDYGFKMVYYDVNSDGEIIVPVDVEQATYLQAKFLLDTQTNCTVEALKMGITSISVGKTSQTVDLSISPVHPVYGIFREAFELLKKYLVTQI